MTGNTRYQLIIRGVNKAGLYKDIKSPTIIPIGGGASTGF